MINPRPAAELTHEGNPTIIIPSALSAGDDITQTFARKMRRFSLSLTIEADGTSEFSERLSLRADPSPNRNVRHTKRHWRHFFLKEAECDIEREIERALERCCPFRDDFRRWSASGAYIELFVGIFSASNVAFTIGPKTLARAGELGFSIGFDYYPRTNANKGRQTTASPSPAT